MTDHLAAFRSRCRAPGIYLGLPEEDYHADPSFSRSGIEDLLVSPLVYWARSAFNPRRPAETKSAAQRLGSAYHKMLLEGPDAFEAAYWVKPCQADYPDALANSDAIKAWLKDRGQKQSGALPDLIDRARSVDPDVEIWPAIRDEMAAMNASKEPLSKDDWVEIQMAKAVLERMPALAEAFTDGFSEVSVFWVDEETGVPMKARKDFLKTGKLIDLKTFGNVMDKPIAAAVASEIARNKYYIQPPVYQDAHKAARQMYAEHGLSVIDEGPIALTDATRKTIDEIFTAAPRFFFVFVQTGGVPDMIGREWKRTETFGNQGATVNEYYRHGHNVYRLGMKRFRDCLQHYGPDVPWITDHGIRPFVTEDFPLWMMSEVA